MDIIQTSWTPMFLDYMSCGKLVHLLNNPALLCMWQIMTGTIVNKVCSMYNNCNTHYSLSNPDLSHHSLYKVCFNVFIFNQLDSYLRISCFVNNVLHHLHKLYSSHL